MFPIGDERHPGATGAPIVTWGLIALNALAFFVELSQPSPTDLQAFVTAWGVVPREYSLGRDLPPDIPLPYWTTLLTSMFLHGGWAHLGGNMLYLWIFGDNLEHRMGHARFLVFYLVTGFAAGLAHIVFSAGSSVPTVGASGAISGVLGGYILLFPHNRIRMLTRMGIVYVPAWIALGFWILIQLVSQAGSMARTQEGGVAYLAHIGGFVAGLALVRLLAGRGTAAPRRMGEFRY